MRFDERAESYDAHAAPQRRFAEALAAFAPFRRGVRVAELGAGTGFLTAALLAQGVDVRAHGVLESEETYPSALDFFRHLHRSGVTGDPRLSPSELRSLLRDYDRLHARPGGVVATWAWLLIDATARG